MGKRGLTVAVLDSGTALLGQQYGPAALPILLAELAAVARNRQGVAGGGQLAVAHLQLEEHLRDPGRAGTQIARAPHVVERGLLVACLHGLVEEAAQAEKGRLAPVQHGGEIALGRFLIAVQLSGLGGQQQGQRRLVEQLVGPLRQPLGLIGRASGHGDHALGQGLVTTLALVLGEGTLDRARRAPRRRPEAVEPGGHDRHHEDGEQQDADGCLNAVAEPVDTDVAGALGQPQGQRDDNGELEEKPE